MKTPKRRKPRMHLGQPEVALAVTAAQWDWLATHNPDEIDSSAKAQWPGFTYWRNVAANCALCEYGLKQVALHGKWTISNTKCTYCLLPTWQATGISKNNLKCCRVRSPYSRWCATRSKKAALAIRDMALTELVRNHWKRLALKSFCYIAAEDLYVPITNAGRTLQPSYEVYAPNRAVDGTYCFGRGVQAIYGWRLHDPSTWLCLTSQQYTIARSALSCTHFLINPHVASALNFWESAGLRKRKANPQGPVFKEFLPIMPLTSSNRTALIKLLDEAKDATQNA